MVNIAFLIADSAAWGPLLVIAALSLCVVVARSKVRNSLDPL